MKKKIITSLLTLAMAAQLCACGGDGVQRSADGDLVLPEKTLELTVWETQGTDFAAPAIKENSVTAKWLEDNTKVKVKNMYGNDGGQWDAKLTKLVAGNNMPDIVHCGSFQGPAHFNRVREVGQLVELDPELIKKYAPLVWEKTPQEIWDAFTLDNGKISGIPSRLDYSYDEPFTGIDEETKDFIRELSVSHVTDVTYNATQTLYIRDDILRKIYPEAKSYDEIVEILNEKQKPIGDELLDIPIFTTEEFVDFLYKIRELNIKEDGKTVYPFGYNGGDNWVALTQFGSDMMGYKNHCYSGTFNAKTQKYELMLAHDVIKESAKIQNKMINDDVIDPESLFHTAAAYNEKILNGLYAITPITYVDKPDVINADLEKNGKSFRYRPFITQVPNMEEYPAFKEKVYWHEAICLTKSLSEEEVILVLNWLNVQYSDEFDKISYWGPEEAGLYTEDENGKPVYKDDRFTQYFLEGDKSALTDDELLGLGNPKDRRATLMPFYPLAVSQWDPVVVNRKLSYHPRSDSGFKFPADSLHVKAVVEYPQTQIWSSAYADIPEVVTYWSSREQWENDVKLALSAPDGMFETKWEEMLINLNDIVNIEDFENKTTEVIKSQMK